MGFWHLIADCGPVNGQAKGSAKLIPLSWRSGCRSKIASRNLPCLEMYWRTVKEDGSLNDKFPGGAAAQARKLCEDGHTIAWTRGGSRPKVPAFAGCLIGL